VNFLELDTIVLDDGRVAAVVVADAAVVASASVFELLVV